MTDDITATDRGMKDVFKIDEAQVRGHVDRIVVESVEQTLAYMSFPREHWTRLRTNNPLERLMREIKRRTKVVGAFPDGNSAVMLSAARLRHVAGTRWGTRKYLDMDRLTELEREREQQEQALVTGVAV